MFAQIDKLETDRYLIRSLLESDYDALFRAASDPAIWVMHSEVLRYQKEGFRIYFDKIMSLEAPLVIVDKANSQIMGSSTFYEYSPKEAKVLLGYSFLETKYWGGSPNLEIKRCLVNFALRFVKTVEFEISPNNLRSRRAAEKIGAVYDRHTEKSAPNGTKLERCVYKISDPIA